MDLKQTLCGILDLPPEASDAEIEAEVKKLDSEAEAEMQAEEAKAKGPAQCAEARLAQVEQELHATRRKNAEGIVEAHATRGAIPPQNAPLREQWVQLLTANPDNVKLLESMTPPAALQSQPITAGANRVQVTAESQDTLVKAYSSERDPLKRGQLWRRELKPSALQCGGVRVNAANSIGTTAGSLVLQESLDLLVEKFPLLTLISRDFSDASIKANQAVYTRIITPPTINDYSTSTGYAFTPGATTTDVSITIDKHKFVAVEFRVDELAGTNRDLFGEQSEGMQYTLGSQIYSDLLALITAGNFTAKSTVAVADFGRNACVDLDKDMSTNKVPRSQRQLLLNPSYYAKLSQDLTVVAALYNSAHGNAITTGELPDVSGFRVHQVVSLPTTGNLTGFALTPAALAIAARVPNDYTQVFGAQGAQVQTVTQPESGLSAMYVGLTDHALGKAIGRVAIMYGVAKAHVTCGQRIVSA